MARSLPAYSSGTVTVAYTGSAWTVTGSGTNFISPDGVPNYTLLGGDMFVIPGVGMGTIGAVASAGSFTLDNWTGGAVASASSYKIYRFEGLPSQAAAALINELLTLFTDANPPAYATVDTGAVRSKWDDDGSGNARMRVRPSNAATGDAAYVTGLLINDATGKVTAGGIVLQAFTGDTGSGGAAGLVPAPPTGSAAANEVLGAGGAFVGMMAGFRNRVINGNFDVWQRGTSFTLATGASQYCADRFFVINSTGVSATVGKVSAPTGFRGKYAHNLVAAGVAIGGFADVTQRFEAQSIYDMDSRPCTLSFDFYATTSAGTLAGIVYIGSNTATDNGTFSNVVGLPFTVTGSSGAISVSLTATQAAGLKYGAAIDIRVTQAGATGNINFNVGAVQFEPGLQATPFEHRPIGVELALCQRYLPAFNDNGSGVTGLGLVAASSSTTLVSYHPFSVPTRVAPTGVIVSAASGFLSGGPISLTPTAAALNANTSAYAGQINWTVAGATPGQAASFRTNSTSAQILFTGCEL